MTILILLLVLVVAGCDTDSDKSVTGDYVFTEPRDISYVSIPSDSVSVASTFQKAVGTSSYTLAGRYSSIEASSVYKFPVYSVRRDNVIGSYITFDVGESWSDGEPEFDLYETNVDWDDSLRVFPEDFVPSLGVPLATAVAATADTTSDISSILFTIDPEIVKAWGDNGGLLLKASDNGTALANILSDDTTYPPTLHLVKDYGGGDIDTTLVYSNEGTFFLESLTASSETRVSDGDGSGYVLFFNIPEQIPPLSTINRCVMTLSMTESVLPDEPFNVGIYRLEEEIKDPDAMETDTDTGTSVSIYSDEDFEEIDITEIVNKWHVGGETNLGIVIEPLNPGESPNQCHIAAIDSLSFTYTPFPDVK